MISKKNKLSFFLILTGFTIFFVGCNATEKNTEDSEMPNVISERKVIIDGEEMVEQTFDNGMSVQSPMEEDESGSGN